MELKEVDIRNWCKEIIKGKGGFLTFESHEFPVWFIPREQAVAEWVIKCLANPENKEAQLVLNAIIEQRNRERCCVYETPAYVQKSDGTI